MGKIPEATARLFNRVFVCRKCKTKIKADSVKIRAKKIKCRRCDCRDFRPKSKEKKVKAK
jgi:ribosomal protein L40E